MAKIAFKADNSFFNDGVFKGYPIQIHINGKLVASSAAEDAARIAKEFGVTNNAPFLLEEGTGFGQYVESPFSGQVTITASRHKHKAEISATLGEKSKVVLKKNNFIVAAIKHQPMKLVIK